VYNPRRAQISITPRRKPEITLMLSELTGQFKDPVKLTEIQVVKFNTADSGLLFRKPVPVWGISVGGSTGIMYLCIIRI
jgi:hypothetical protein